MFFSFFVSLRTIFFKLSFLVSSLVRDFLTSSSWLDFTLWNIRKPILLLLNKTNMMFMMWEYFKWLNTKGYLLYMYDLIASIYVNLEIFSAWSWLTGWLFSVLLVFLHGGGGAPYKGYIGMCGPKERSFSVVLVINGVSNFCHFVINRACFSNEAAFSSLRLIRPSIKALPKLCLRRFNIGLN